MEWRNSVRTFGLSARPDGLGCCLRYVAGPESRANRPARTPPFASTYLTQPRFIPTRTASPAILSWSGEKINVSQRRKARKEYKMEGQKDPFLGVFLCVLRAFARRSFFPAFSWKAWDASNISTPLSLLYRHREVLATLDEV